MLIGIVCLSSLGVTQSFFLAGSQDRTSQFSALCSGSCLCQLEFHTLRSLRTCHALLMEQCTLRRSTLQSQFRWESIKPGVILFLQPGERKMTHVTKPATAGDTTLDSGPGGVISEENEVNRFWYHFRRISLLDYSKQGLSRLCCNYVCFYM